MKLDQAIREAVASNEPRKLEEVVAFMRSRGWNYETSLKMAIQSIPDMTRGRWDEMLMSIDNNAPTLGN